MDIIRYGNDINVSWSVYGRNGSKYSLARKIEHLWLVSGPRKKEISAYTIQARNRIVFLVDDTEINRLGTFKFVLEIKEPESEVEEATYELSHVFQVVSETYPMKANKVINGQTNIDIKSILNNVYVSTLEGASAYEVAVQNGYQGTEQEWLGEFVASVRCDFPDLIFTRADNSTITVDLTHTHPSYETAISGLQTAVGAIQTMLEGLVSLVSNGTYYTLSVGNVSVDFYSKAQVDALLASGGTNPDNPDDTIDVSLNFSANEVLLPAAGTEDTSVRVESNISWELSASGLPNEEEDEEDESQSTATVVSLEDIRVPVGGFAQIEERK